MSSSTTSSASSKKDAAWKWTTPIPGNIPIAGTTPSSGQSLYFLCSFCKQRCTGGISRFKQHLVGSRRGIKACPKVPPNVKEWCILALKRNEEEKFAKLQVCREIGGLEPLEEEDEEEDAHVRNMVSSESGSAQTPIDVSSLGQPKPRGPMDKYVATTARQTTLNSTFKKEERRDVCRAIGRMFYTSGLAFNVANNPYYFAALEKVANYGPGFKPPSSHELRTWILNDEVYTSKKMLLLICLHLKNGMNVDVQDTKMLMM